MIDTVSGSPWADLLFNLLASFAQFERSLIAERVRAGMARARKQGRHVGRPHKVNGEWENVRPLILAGALSQKDAAETLGVSRSTVSRLLVQKGGVNGASGSLVQ